MAGGGGVAPRRFGLRGTVLHLRSGATLAGPERHLLELAPALAERGVAIEIALLVRRRSGERGRHPLVAELARSGRRALLVEDPDLAGSAASAELAKRLEGVAGLHGHDPKANWVAARLARAHALPWYATVHLHTRSSWRTRLHARVDRWRLRRARGIVAVAHAIARELPASCRKRAVVIPNGLDVEALEARAVREEPAARAALAALPGRPVVLAAGRLEAQKGFDRLLRALAAARERGSGLGLAIAGEGSERNRLERLAARLGFGEAVRLLGARDDLAGLLAAADGVVVPSRREGLPYVLLEAMALGRPLVATAVGGIPEVVTDRREGRLVAAGDEAALVDGLLWLERGGVETGACGLRARERVRAELGAARMAEGYARLYAETLT